MLQFQEELSLSQTQKEAFRMLYLTKTLLNQEVLYSLMGVAPYKLQKANSLITLQ